MAREQRVGLSRAVANGEGARDAERIEAVEVAPGRQDVGRSQQVAARRRSDVAARRARARSPASRDRSASSASSAARRSGSVTPAASSISARAAAEGGLPRTCRPCGISVYSSSRTSRCRRATSDSAASSQAGSARGEFDRRGLRLDHGRERRALPGVGIRIHRPPAIDRGLEIDQAAIQPRFGHRRRQIADQRRAGAALGERTFGRIVRGVEIEVRQVGDQPVRPALGGQPGLFAGHEFERAMGAEMQHRMGAEILAQIAVEGAEGMRRREALLEQQPHRVAFVAEGGLHADEDIAEMRAEDEDVAPVGLVTAGRGAPLRLDLGQPALLARHVRRRTCGARHWHRRRSASRCRRGCGRAGRRRRREHRWRSRLALQRRSGCGAAIRTPTDRRRCRWRRHSAGS